LFDQQSFKDDLALRGKIKNLMSVVEMKVMLAGDTSVGKTSLILRLIKGQGFLTANPTIGVDVKKHIIDVMNTKVTLHLWDTAGQERFRSIVTSYFRGADAAIIVYDASNQDSLESLPYWIAAAREYNPHLPISLVGNKIDIQNLVNDEAIDELSTQHNAKNYFCSAKTGEGVEDPFFGVAQDVIMSHKDSLRQPSVKLSQNEKIENKSCC